MSWFRRKPDPEKEARRAAADAALAELEAIVPPAWEIGRDREQFRFPNSHIYVWGAWAASEAEGRYEIAFGRDEADAYRQVAARIGGDLQPTAAWRPPSEWIRPEPDANRIPGFGVNAEAAEYEAALRELEAAVPEGWILFDCDRERFRMPGYRFETFGCTALGPQGEIVFTMGVGVAGSLLALKDALEGRLDETPAWAPLLDV